MADLSKIKGLGPAKAATILAAVELGRRVAGADPQKKVKLSSPEACVSYLMPRMRYEQQEKFLVLLLDSKNQLLKCQQVSEGTLNASVVHPREVFAPAMLHRAGGFRFWTISLSVTAGISALEKMGIWMNEV